MGQKNLKQIRRVAEKTAKAHAMEMAKAQLMEIANALFKIRWRFCKAILFPKKLKLDKSKIDEIKSTARGGHVSQAVVRGKIMHEEGVKT